jgi:hypothetical protein
MSLSALLEFCRESGAAAANPLFLLLLVRVIKFDELSLFTFINAVVPFCLRVMSFPELSMSSVLEPGAKVTESWWCCIPLFSRQSMADAVSSNSFKSLSFR